MDSCSYSAKAHYVEIFIIDANVKKMNYATSQDSHTNANVHLFNFISIANKHKDQ